MFMARALMSTVQYVSTISASGSLPLFSRQTSISDFVNLCSWANATVGNECVIENTPYVVYTSAGEYADVVSRSVILPIFFPCS